MSKLIVTIDLDWACEPAIEETIVFFNQQNIPITVFITHDSNIIRNNINIIEVGLHPYFSPESSHGATITEVVKYVMDLPHNICAFRCHRFAICNTSKQAMVEAGMKLSSNVCTDLAVVAPFKDRFGLLEVPIFLEDGGYLWNKHPLEITNQLLKLLEEQSIKVIVIHPMHFVLNTPCFAYMSDIKRSMSRKKWQAMNNSTLNKLKWHGKGIRDVIVKLLELSGQKLALGNLIAKC